jgi:hypothetical protein
MYADEKKRNIILIENRYIIHRERDSNAAGGAAVPKIDGPFACLITVLKLAPSTS